MKENSRISSITNGPRQSNFELLRILAMFLVLVVHAAFYANGAPTCEDFQNNFLPSLTKTIFESISIVCVNIFILISGWFGIKPSIKGLGNFLFQCGFFLFSIYLFFLITGQISISLKGVAGCLCLTRLNWFIRAYVALYILSPVLNAFIEKASQKQYKYVLIAFFIFQTIWGWSNAAKFIEQGYSTFSFIGLYLLARYIRIYGIPKLTAWGGAFYAMSIILNTIGYYITAIYRIPIDIFSYVNPMIIGGAMGLLLFFNSLKIKTNKLINWIAKSSFAVYLLHSNPNIGHPFFNAYIVKIYSTESGIHCIFNIFIFLIIVFVIAIILDQPRKWLWNKIVKNLYKCL